MTLAIASVPAMPETATVLVIRRHRLFSLAVAIMLSASACAADSDATTAEAVPTTTAVAEPEPRCAAEFAQTWDAYGWEQCLFGDLAYGDAAEIGAAGAHLLSLGDARLLVRLVWREFGAGPAPSVRTGGQHCGNAAGAADHGSHTICVSDPTDTVTVLHEVAHFLAGPGPDGAPVFGDHGLEFRCAAADVYATFVPDLIDIVQAAALNEACGLTAAQAVAAAPQCRFDTAAWAASAPATAPPNRRAAQATLQRLNVWDVDGYLRLLPAETQVERAAAFATAVTVDESDPRHSRHPEGNVSRVTELVLEWQAEARIEIAAGEAFETFSDLDAPAVEQAVERLATVKNRPGDRAAWDRYVILLPGSHAATLRNLRREILGNGDSERLIALYGALDRAAAAALDAADTAAERGSSEKYWAPAGCR